MTWLKHNYASILSILTAVAIGLVLILLINVQSQNAIRLKDQKQILDNLKQAVTDLKADNERQTRFIGCLLAIHGEGQLVSDDVRAQCQRMSDGIVLEDVTKSSETQSPAETPSSTPQAPQRNKIISPVIDQINKVTSGKACIGGLCI